MKKFLLTLTTMLLFAVVAYAGMGSVITSWPAPQSTFNRVNGIAFEGKYIWVKDRVCESHGGVVKCTKSGSFLSSISFPYSPAMHSFGLTFDGEYLWTIYEWWHIPYHDSYRKYTTTGSYVGGFWLHINYLPESKAVTWDGQYLYTDETRPPPNRIGKYTTAGTLVATFPMTVGVGSDMAYYKRQLWYYGGGLVYGVTLNGSVVASFAAPGGSCASTAFDGEYLWTADRNTPQYIYKVDIDVVDVAPASVGRVKALYR